MKCSYCGKDASDSFVEFVGPRIGDPVVILCSAKCIEAYWNHCHAVDCEYPDLKPVVKCES